MIAVPDEKNVSVESAGDKNTGEEPETGQPGLSNGEPLEVLHTKPEISGPPP